jgi:hypothetical protein
LKIYLGGLTDNGLNGTNGNEGERDWSNDEHVIKFELGFFWIIRCCKLDFRGFFVLDRCSGIFVWTTTDIVLSASTASSNAFIDNLTSDLIDSITGDWQLVYLLINAWSCNLLSVGEEDRTFDEVDCILKRYFY